MEQLESFTQTYIQAPWRKQLQLIGLFLLFLVMAAVVAGVYLSISAKAVAVGRDIQEKQRWIEIYDREIEDQESQLAAILSSDQMEERARRLGFQPIRSDQIVYMNIPGYGERWAVVAASVPLELVSAPVQPEHYTESIFTWLKRQAAEQNLGFSRVYP